MAATAFRDWARPGFGGERFGGESVGQQKSNLHRIEKPLCQLRLTQTEFSHSMPIVIISEHLDLSTDDTTGIHHRQRHVTIPTDVIVNPLPKNPLLAASDIQYFPIDS